MESEDNAARYIQGNIMLLAENAGANSGTILHFIDNFKKMPSKSYSETTIRFVVNGDKIAISSVTVYPDGAINLSEDVLRKEAVAILNDIYFHTDVLVFCPTCRV